MKERRTSHVHWLTSLAAIVLLSPPPQSGAGQAPARTVPPLPPELSALAAKAPLEGPIAAWCRGGLRPNGPDGFAVAVAASGGGGRYVVLETDGTVVDLARFTGQPEVSCYSRAEARRLNDTIRQSQTIHGEVEPRWNTTVVCGFVEETSAVCWQHSPDRRAFVKIGGWVT